MDEDKHLIQEFDAAQLYREEAVAFEKAVENDPDEAHAILNGKWLIEHLAYVRTKNPHEDIRYYWSDHARSVGGLAEVRALWERITGSPP